jgi:hypothetical protein
MGKIGTMRLSRYSELEAFSRSISLLHDVIAGLETIGTALSSR